MQNVIRCAKCVNVCPMGLNPAFLMRSSAHQLFEDAQQDRIMDCIECGSCSYICPANRCLLDYIRLGKGKVGAMLRAQASSNAPKK